MQIDPREGQIGIAENPANRTAAETAPALLIGEELFTVRPIGQLLIEAGLISDNDVARGIAFQERLSREVGKHPRPARRALGRAPAADIERSTRYSRAEVTTISPGMRHRISMRSPSPGIRSDWWVDQEALPWLAHGALWVVAKDPLITDLQEFVCAAYGTIPVRWGLAASQVIDRALEKVQDQGTATGAISRTR